MWSFLIVIVLGLYCFIFQKSRKICGFNLRKLSCLVCQQNFIKFTILFTKCYGKLWFYVKTFEVFNTSIKIDKIQFPLSSNDMENCGFYLGNLICSVLQEKLWNSIEFSQNAEKLNIQTKINEIQLIFPPEAEKFAV